jgi:acetolactate synthase-1/2/3 large subunit
MKKTAVEWLVEDLQRRGVEWVATLCGHGLDPFFYAARQAGLRLIDVRNEQTASYMADACGRLTRKPGVCAVSSGVAVANALAGMVNAHLDGAPMILLSGSAALPTLGKGAFQDLDQVELAASVSKDSRLVDHPSRVLHLLDEAWTKATTGTPGPAHLMIPMDVQRAPVHQQELARASRQGAGGAAPVGVEKIARAIAAAKRPLMIAGSGVYYACQGQALIQFAERFQIPVQTPIWDRGIFDRESESFLGVAGAASGGPDLLSQTDCLVLSDVASDYRVGYLRQSGAVHRVGQAWPQLAAAYSQAGGKSHEDWLRQARAQRVECTGKVRAAASAQRQAGRCHSIDIIDAIARELPVDGVLVIDGGSIGQWAHQLLCQRRYPGHWLTCGRSGVVGYGLAGAMAARLAFPDKPVVLLSGDGAFTFTVAEIECAVRQKLPFVAIVADDQSWGITQTGHVKQFGHPISTQLGPIRFDALADSLGARGVLVDSPGRIAPELQAAMKSGTVTVLHVPTVGGNPS